MLLFTIFAADNYCLTIIKVAATLKYGIIIMYKDLFSSLEVRECDYKGEHYSAREDGMVLRHIRPCMRKRKYDDVWTYGNLDASNGYLFVGSARVHIIIATAFHGARDSKIYVVDHIDTNRQNNRPENLRWFTRFENALMNEITRKKIELICGSIEAFIENPSLLRGHEDEDTNFIWMKNVTKEEAKNCYDNWIKWARTTKATHDPNYKKKGVGEWIYSKPKENVKTSLFDEPKRKYDVDKNTLPEISNLSDKESVQQEEEWDTTESLTPTAVQRSWKTPTEFPCCPTIVNDEGLDLYEKNMIEGEVFSKNIYGTYYVVNKGFLPDKSELIVLATNNKEGTFMSWSLASITIRNGKYVHSSINARLGKDLSRKYFNFIIGKGDLTDEEFNMTDCL